MRTLLAVASLIVIGGCAVSSGSPEHARFSDDLRSGQWISMSYSEMAIPVDPGVGQEQDGIVALAMADPEAVALVFCEPETRRPVAALFAPSRSDWTNKPGDPDFPIRVRADGGKWQTFHGTSLSDAGPKTSHRPTKSVGVADHDAIRFGEIIGQAKSDIWIDAGGRKHRLPPDEQRLVEQALDSCRADFSVPPKLGV